MYDTDTISCLSVLIKKTYNPVTLKSLRISLDIFLAMYVKYRTIQVIIH
jgi:hypothetical protein